MSVGKLDKEESKSMSTTILVKTKLSLYLVMLLWILLVISTTKLGLMLKKWTEFMFRLMLKNFSKLTMVSITKNRLCFGFTLNRKPLVIPI
jgi:hypothetical protein